MIVVVVALLSLANKLSGLDFRQKKANILVQAIWD